MKSKNLLLLALVTLFALAFSSCSAKRVAASDVTVVDGSNDHRTFKVDSFDRIELSGVSTIRFTQGSHVSVTATGSSRELNSLDVYTKGGCLYVKNKNEMGSVRHQGCELVVVAPKLTDLSVCGVCSFYASKLDMDHFNLKVSGVSSFHVEQINCNDTHFDVSGVGNINTTVTGDKLYADLSGVSNSKISFKGKTVNIENSGVGKTTLYVECDELKASNSGNATLKIKGTADDTHVDNSGLAKIDTSELNQY